MTDKIALRDARWTALFLALALLVGTSSTAVAKINRLPPGTASSGAIPIGTGSGEAPPNQWSYVPFSDTSCGDPGTTAGIDIYPSSTANKGNLLIYFEGGGWCDDYNSCFLMRSGEVAPGFQSIVSNLNGFNASVPSDVTFLQNNNAADGNPFTDWSKVFVRYCTGDMSPGTTSPRTWIRTALATQLTMWATPIWKTIFRDSRLHFVLAPRARCPHQAGSS
jgi:Pectinacetylesterase